MHITESKDYYDYLFIAISISTTPERTYSIFKKLQTNKIELKRELATELTYIIEIFFLDFFSLNKRKHVTSF